MSANSPANSLGPVPEFVDPPGWPAWLTQIARTVNYLLRGKIGATTTLTLTANATSTTLTDDRIGIASFISLVPLTSSATAIDIVPYPSARTKGSATISHGSSPATDLNFVVLIIG